MLRQSALARAYASFGQQRKLFLLVFLWTCFCFFLFRSSLMGGPASETPGKPDERPRAAAQRTSWPPPASAKSPSTITGKASRRSEIGELAGSSDKISNHNHAGHDGGRDSPSQAECHYEYPSLFNLQFNNIHWQKMSFSGPSSADRPNATFYLYNAYYDDRWRAGGPSVRILAMIDRIEPPPTNCLLWSSKSDQALLDATNPQAASSSSSSPSETESEPTAAGAATATTADSSSSRKKRQQASRNTSSLRPIVTRANFVYAWYPKWGNYMDGILQPWIVTCPVPAAFDDFVPESVSLVQVPPEIELPHAHSYTPKLENIFSSDEHHHQRSKRQVSPASSDNINSESGASIAMPPSFSSSSSSSSFSPSSSSSVSPPPPPPPSAPAPAESSAISNGNSSLLSDTTTTTTLTASMLDKKLLKLKSKHIYDCKRVLPITNNLPVYNRRPQTKGKFAVCVKGLDFPEDDISVRLVEWIELLNLLGAGKIFLYDLDVHENISKVLNYYEKRGIVELSPLTLPGDQPNLPEFQHLYLKSKLTAKRQNELIPYNDCLYRNLYSFQYLALLDIDEIIMPLRHHNWFDLMQEVEDRSFAEQNYSRASYNVRNVYFFDDLAGPLGTTSSSSSSPEDNSLNGREGHSKNSQANSQNEQSLEHGIPHYLHMMQHVYRSRNYTKPGQYVKCFHNTERVVSLHNHFPMNCFGQCTTYSIPIELAHLQHYRKDCVGPLKQSCKNEFRAYTTRDTTIWKYKQQMIRRTTRVLNHLGFLKKKSENESLDRKR